MYNDSQMPHIRKPSKIISLLNANDNGILKENNIAPKVENIITKVDQINTHEAIHLDGSNEEGNRNDANVVSISDNKKVEGNDVKQTNDKKLGEKNTKGNEGAIKKIETVNKAGSDDTGKETGNGKNFRNSVETVKNSENVFLTNVSNFSGKDKKVKFADGCTSKPETFRKSSYQNKQDKQKLYSYKSEPKTTFSVPHLPEYFVPQVGEIAVLTDLVPDDPISACLPCLEANGTYICTPCNPRCFIIQKVSLT